MQSPKAQTPMGSESVNPFHDPQTPRLSPHSNDATDGNVSCYDPYEINAEYQYDTALSSPPPTKPKGGSSPLPAHIYADDRRSKGLDPLSADKVLAHNPPSQLPQQTYPEPQYPQQMQQPQYPQQMVQPQYAQPPTGYPPQSMGYPPPQNKSSGVSVKFVLFVLLALAIALGGGAFAYLKWKETRSEEAIQELKGEIEKGPGHDTAKEKGAPAPKKEAEPNKEPEGGARRLLATEGGGSLFAVSSMNVSPTVFMVVLYAALAMLSIAAANSVLQRES